MSLKEYRPMSVGELEVGRWYVGRGRNGDLGLWNGEDFVVPTRVGVKVGPGPRDWETRWGCKLEPCFGPDGGCFQPFRVVDMGEVAEPHEEPGYARVLVMRD